MIARASAVTLLTLNAACGRATIDSSGESHTLASARADDLDKPEAVGAVTLSSSSVAPPVRISAGVKDLRVTRGEVVSRNDFLHIENPVVRAVTHSPAQGVTLRFQYLGPTEQRVALSSGDDQRVQIGAKLRAADGCNVVYAVWRIEPKQELVVQVKHNPEMHTHDDCGATGYARVRASRAMPPPHVEAGEWHTLSARVVGHELIVSADDAPAWRGQLPPEAFLFDGPIAFRTDNGRFDLSLSSLTDELHAE